ncbi:FAD-dependent oxidoreductase [Halorhabdus sp. CBA1104]|uniref:FAD-dependent oxidoreductase n=1 Tax=Halorhabdus sp. CBA1104 TaxID=1380432 RepID=UPI0018A6CD4C|nr:FAD-dependent oxidoreductase [Halorhabdus sp. CBA1104]
MDRSVCVIGGGIAGAGAALALPDALDVTVFESRAVGGRLASRRREGCIYDVGTDHVLLADGDLRELVADAAGDSLVEIDRPVKQFDADGTISERPAEFPRFSGRDGIDTLVQSLFETSGARIEEGATVTALDRRGGQWVVTAAGHRRAFDAAVLAVPAAAAVVLFEGADWDATLRRELARAADDSAHRSIDVVALHYPFAFGADYYGLVSIERASDVVWMGREQCKRGHVPDGESVLTLQLGSLWSAANANASARETAIESAHYVARLVGDDRLREPDWWDHHRWGQGVPTDGVDAALYERPLEFGLAIAGDWVAGVGQAHAALASGLRAGRQLAERFGSDPGA